MTIIYGIPNCDSVKKARKWLEHEGIQFQFHDFRKHALNSEQIHTWLSAAGAEALLNKRSTTWKQLNESQKSDALSENPNKLVALMLEQPTLIKRPVLEHQGQVQLGFNEQRYREIFTQ